MRSPRRSPLISRNGRDMMLQDPAYVLKKENERRRLIRIQQVRMKSAEAARSVRQRVRREQVRQITKIAKDELQKYIQKKTEELTFLETEYQKALQDIGLGHEGVKEHNEFLKWKEEQAVLNRQVAEVRGEHATKVVQHQTRLKTKLGEEKSELKKCVKLTEDARAAEIRARKKNLHIDPSSTGKVIEIDPYADADADQKRVRFAGEGSRRNPNVLVRHLGKENISRKPGIEAAIREETASRQLTLDQKKAARMRGLAALKRAKIERPRTTESYFEDTDPEAAAVVDTTDSDVSQSINAQVQRISRPRPKSDVNDEVDFFPSKLSARPSSSTSTIDDSAESSLHATISRPSMRGAFDLKETDIQLPHPGEDIVGQIYGQASGAKSNIPARSPSTIDKKHKKEQDFIAKVLEGFEMSDRENLQVNIEVDEQSTLHSSASSRVATMSSSSSSDITRERFLSKEWKTSTDIKKLIGTLRSDDRKPSDKTRNTELKAYIERLLKMKREEIVNLSITDTTSEMSSISNSNIISSPSIQSETTTQQGFASSTPASILVSSGTTSGSSSGKSSQNKSVRFKDQDELDATYQPSSSKQILSKEEEDKQKKIIERTRLSLEKVHAYYEEQRKHLEAQLEARRKLKQKEEVVQQQQQNPQPKSPLSEGPLSTTSSSNSSDKHSNSSAKETNDDINKSSKKTVVRKSHHALSRQMVARLNKSSSSGTTTTTSSGSSMATEELLKKLRLLKAPQLQRPPPPALRIEDQALVSPDELNTSADLLKATDLEASSPEQDLKIPSSFHFTSDGDDKDDQTEILLRKDISNITLSSSD